MTGITAYEGTQYIGNVLYKGATQEDLYLGLFTAPAVPNTSTEWGDITQPSGTGYAEIQLTTGNFTVSALGVVTYPQQVFTAGDDWSPGSVYGYYIRNDAGTPVILHMELLNSPPFQMTAGRKIAIDLSVDTS